ncbi:Trehalose utilization [Planctomycetes bacterium Pan216]|uniref:Trehalose utilization n=1 Tax=Kolteria novifilia TaxID=2527975 RepID=A0A518B092_9BACT|nr:Trehalose utilization [Planctomycetes bacterium Pan216]
MVRHATWAIGIVLCLCQAASAEPLVYEGASGPGVGKHIVFLAGDHEYRSEETLPALARILAKRYGYKCTVLFTVDPNTGEIDPAADNMPGTKTLDSADLAVIFLRFKNLPADQMQPIVDYLERGGPVVGLRTATHAFKIPKDSPFARFDFQYPGDDYSRGFGRQVLGESWSGHYGKNHVMSTRLDPVPSAKSHPILRGVERPWVQAGGYWTEPMEDSVVLAMAQPLESMKPTASPAPDKSPCPGAWVRTYSGKDGTKGRVFTTTYGASEDILDEDFRRMLVNATLWAIGDEASITPNMNVDFVGEYHPVTFRFGGHRRGVKPADIKEFDSPIYDPESPVVVPPRKKRK